MLLPGASYELDPVINFFYKQAEGAGKGPTATKISTSEKRGAKYESEIEIERRQKHIEARHR